MTLGKRSRSSMMRTTSMTELALGNLNKVEDATAFDDDPQNSIKNGKKVLGPESKVRSNTNNVDADVLYHQFMATVSPRNHQWRNLGHFVQMADFLKVCNLCKRSLRVGQDIYIYRGDTAFCSEECREQQINEDEQKEKRAVELEKEDLSASGSEASSNGETIVAA